MDNNSIHVKYLITNGQDVEWGLTVNSVGFQTIKPEETYPPQNHPSRYLFNTEKGRILEEYQLLYITRGGGEFISVKGGRYTLSDGKMFLLFPEEWHSYRPDESTGWDEYWIGFNSHNMEKRINAAFFNKQNPILNVGLQNEIVNMYLQAITVAKEQKTGFQQMLAGIVEFLLGFAFSHNKSASFEELKAVKLIEKSKLIILENLYTKITPEEVASKIHMSYSWYRKIFKQYTGFSPAQYINEIKIQKSKELLTNSDLSNIEISDKLGFDSPNYFCTLFKNKVKVTPMKYREITQGKYITRNMIL